MGTLNVDDDQRMRELQQEYLDFLDDDQDSSIYTKKLKDMISDGRIRLIVNINDLRRKNPARAKKLLSNGFEELIAFQRSLKEFVGSADPVFAKQYEDFFVGLEGSFGGKHVTPRTLTSSLLGCMVCVEGIVTKSSLIRPKVVRSVHYCPTTKKTIERKYTDMTSLEAFPSTGIYPTKDDDGNLLETEYGLSIYKDHQTFSIQEMPEKAPAGQLPRSVDVICDDDLVDACKPGDRVQIVGLYRCLPSKKNGFTNGTFRTVLVANNIQLLSKEASPTFSAKDISMIKKFGKQKGDVFEILANSLAPTIWGFEYVKKAILCMLLGGVEKILENGTRIRGDINLLLIGDPSVAKSQMLRYVLHTAPRAVTTTGRGSSGVGLTAAVTTDFETGERRLEAGAMVLADRGIVCIDEFDKMSDIDRTAIHEVMEQGRVTISKAGIHAKLNARCSVLAAANPVYGRYNQYKTPMENIGLQDSLLSRFDLLFIVLDLNDAENDRMIADHILRVQRFRNPGEQDGEALPLTTSLDLLSTHDITEDTNDGEETQLYEKCDFLSSNKGKGKKERIISMKFMRKYIHVAREMKPIMTSEAADFIAEEYSKLRNQDITNQGDNVARTQPLTARSLETMIRISTAHAKCRLSKKVEVEDAQVAIELIHYAYFKKVLKKEKRRKRANSDEEDDVEPDSEPEDTHVDNKEPKKKKRREHSIKEGDEGFDPYSMDAISDEDDPEKMEERKKLIPAAEKKIHAGSINPERFKQFKASMFKMFKQANAQSLTFDVIQKFLDEEFKSEPYSEEETLLLIDKMQDDNQVMISDKIIFLI